MIRRLKFTTASAVTAALAVAALAGPGAAVDDTSAITLTVTAGALTVDAPATITGTAAATDVITLSVDDIAIDDARGSLAGWTATATVTDLIIDDGADPGETIAATGMLWTTTSITANDGQTSIAVPSAGSLAAPVVMAVGLPVVSPGSFTVDGQITLTVPLNALAGAYTGTLTTTVL